MSERGLVVHLGSLDAMVAAMQATHDDIVATVDATLARVDAEIDGWAQDTASRGAQIAYQRELAAGVQRLCAALDRVRQSLADVRDDARGTEVRNVAVIG
jgi:uncharacterized protein YukE